MERFSKVGAIGAAAVIATAGQAMAIAPAWQWQQTYGLAPTEETIRATIQTRDGGYASVGFRRPAAGGPGDILVIRTDASGTILWQRVYDGGADDEGHSIIQTSDGALAIAGDTTSSGAGFETFVVKLTPAGGVMWGRTYPGAAGGPAPGNSRVIEMTNRDLVIAGRAEIVPGVQQPMLARISAAGVPVFSFTYFDARYGPSMFGGFSDVAERPNPGGAQSTIVPVGFTSPAAGALRQMFVVETGPNGVAGAANAYFPLNFDTYANSVVIAPGDEVAFAGRIVVPGQPQQTALVRTTPVFVPMFGAMYDDVLVSFASLHSLDPVTGVDDFVIGGSVPQGTAAANLDLWLARLGGGGAPIWSVRYGGALNDRGHSAGISDDGLFITGEEQSFGLPDVDAYAVKTDGSGRSGCSESPMNLDRTAVPPMRTITGAPEVPAPSLTWIPTAREVELRERTLCSRCPADLNGDGLVDFADYLEFLNLYDADDLGADYNGDGLIDFSDYLEFLNYYDSCA